MDENEYSPMRACFAAKYDKFWQTELQLRRLLFKNVALKQL